MNEEKDCKMEKIVDKLNKLCLDIDKVPTKRELYDNKININTLNEECKRLGYIDYLNYLASKNYLGKGLIKIGSIYKDNKKIDLNDLCTVINEFFINNQRIPYLKDFINKNNLPTEKTFIKIMKKYGVTYKQILQMINIKETVPHEAWDKNKYDLYVKKYIELSIEKGKPLTVAELEHNEYIPYSKWLIENCPKPINNFLNFVEYCGFKHNRINKFTKDSIEELILSKSKEMNRILNYNDFSSQELYYIRKYWGDFTNMQHILNIGSNNMNMKIKSMNLNDIKKCLSILCDEIFNKENRKIINCSDINNCKYLCNVSTCRNKFVKNGESLREYITELGFEYQKEGMGIENLFDDGEKTKSTHENKFSILLRELNYTFNKSYFRDVKYNTFIDGYEENMNCDYLLNINGRLVYIEIAGFLNRYYNNYRDNIKISNSKSKELYRLKLLEKSRLMSKQGLEYYILFPHEISRDLLLSIINKECVA